MSGSGIFTIVKELTCFIQTAAFLYEVFCCKNTDKPYDLIRIRFINIVLQQTNNQLILNFTISLTLSKRSTLLERRLTVTSI